MTRTHFLSLFTVPFLSRLLTPEEPKKPSNWSAKNVWMQRHHPKKSAETMKYPYSIHECAHLPKELEPWIDKNCKDWQSVQSKGTTHHINLSQNMYVIEQNGYIGLPITQRNTAN